MYLFSVRIYAYAMVLLGRSEDNLQESVLPFYSLGNAGHQTWCNIYNNAKQT